MSKKEILNKLDEILDNAGVNELLGRKKEEEKCNKVLWVFAIIGAVVAVAAVAYAVYRYLTTEVFQCSISPNHTLYHCKVFDSFFRDNRLEIVSKF